MSLLEELEHTYNYQYKSILDTLGFERTEEVAGELGALLGFQNAKLKLHLVNERGIIELLIGLPNDKRQHDSGLIFSLVELELSDNDSDAERRRLLTKRRGAMELAGLFQEHYSKLVELFDQPQYRITTGELSRLGNERSRYLFG